MLDANLTNVAKVLAGELTVDVEPSIEIVRDGIVGVYLDGRFFGEVRREHQMQATAFAGHLRLAIVPLSSGDPDLLRMQKADPLMLSHPSERL